MRALAADHVASVATGLFEQQSERCDVVLARHLAVLTLAALWVDQQVAAVMVVLDEPGSGRFARIHAKPTCHLSPDAGVKSRLRMSCAMFRSAGSAVGEARMA